MYFDFAQYKQKGLAPILIILLIGIVVAAIGGAYYFGKQSKPNPNSADTPKKAELIQENETISPNNPEGWSCGRLAGPAGDATCPEGYTCDYRNSSNPEIGTCVKNSDEATHWKTYISSNNGYSVGYPNTWETYGYGRTPNNDIDVVGERFLRPIGQNDFAITIRATLAKETNYTQAENFIKGFFDNDRKITSITVDGMKGTKVEGQTNGRKQIIAIFTNDKTVIEIQTGSSEGVEKFDQILSTFKFL